MRGHIRERGTSLEVRVYAGNGRTITRTVKDQGSKKETKDTADRLLRRLLDDIDTGNASGPDVLVRQLVTRWLAHAEAEWSPTTRAAYESYLRLHILPALGDMKIGKVAAVDLDQFYGDLRRKKLSPASIGKCHVILRRAFAEAVRWGWLRTNPASDARPPRVSRTDLNPPSALEVRRLLNLAKEKDALLHAFVVLAADTGARRGELCALRWRHLDLDKGELVIEKAMVLDNGRVVEKDTKTHQARRIALGAPAVAVLRDYRVKRNEAALQTGRRIAPAGFVFSTDVAHRTPIRPDGATSRFMRLRKQAKLPHVRLHDLRHALVTDWLAAGVDARTVMGRVGHASLQTLTRYSHFVPAADKDAAKRLGDRHQVI
jgi:integrase